MKAKFLLHLSLILILTLIFSLIPPQPAYAQPRTSGGVAIFSVRPNRICVGNTLTLNGGASFTYLDEPPENLAWLPVTKVQISAALGEVSPDQIIQENEGFFINFTYLLLILSEKEFLMTTNTTATLEQLNTGKILDVATGAGNFLKYLTGTVKSFSEAIGIDFKDTAAAPFNETFRDDPRIHFQVMHAEKMDYPDASFDTVCISNSLHHLTEPELVLKEMLRVLKPGGTLIISEMYCDGDQTPSQHTHILLHHWWAEIDTTQNIVHNKTYTRRELISFVQHLDLDQVATEDVADLSDDPLDPAVFEEIDPIIERYIERAAGNEALQKQGEQIREHLHTVGFHNATSLLLLAKK